LLPDARDGNRSNRNVRFRCQKSCRLRQRFINSRGGYSD
jgi:hypothetical protein